MRKYGIRRPTLIRSLLVAPALVLAFGLQTVFADAMTVTFDSLSDQQTETITGQFPAGVIDWGSDTWYISGPWQRLDNISVGFNGDGPTSASLNVLGSRHLAQLDAYNGGDSDTTVTLSCAGQPDVSAHLAADEVRTISTPWSGACSNVTVSSSNGWFTNFENFVVSS